MIQNKKLIGNFTMFAAAMLFGINFTVTKLILDTGSVDSYSLMFFRIFFGTVAFWVMSLFTKNEKIEKRDIGWIVLAAVLGIIFNQGLFLIGIKQTSPIDASIISTIVPIVTMIMSFIYLKEPLSKMKVGGVGLGALGALALIYITHKGFSGDGSSLTGNLIIVCNAISYSLFFIFSRGISQKYSAVTIMKWMFLISTITTTPFLMDYILSAPILTQSINWLNIGYLAYILIGATFLPYLLVPIAQKYIRPTTMSMYNYIQPLIATFLGILLGQGEITIPKLICALLIFTGVFFVSKSKERKSST